MRRVHRFIAALILMVFVPVAVLAGPMRFCISQDGNQAVELAHAAHDADPNVDAAKWPIVLADSHDDSKPCSDRPLITAHSSSQATKIDSKTSKPDIGFGGADLTRVILYHPIAVPQMLLRYTHPVPVLGDSQLAALRTVILLI